MSEKLIKEKISWYKLLFTVFATALAASIGWFVANFNFEIRWILRLNELGILTLSCGIGAIIYKIRYYFKKLEDVDDD